MTNKTSTRIEKKVELINFDRVVGARQAAVSISETWSK